MTWSYSSADLATSKKDQVRRLVGDVDTTDQMLQDEEINFAITMRLTVYGAAAECARMIAAQLARNVDERAGDTERKSSQRAKAYLQMAVDFDSNAALAGSGMPFAGGISLAQKAEAEQNDDRVTPAFVTGQDDSYVPEPPIGPTPRT